MKKRKVQHELPASIWEEVGQFAMESLSDWADLQRVNRALRTAMHHPRVFQYFNLSFKDPSFTLKIGSMNRAVRKATIRKCAVTFDVDAYDVPDLMAMGPMPALQSLDVSGMMRCIPRVPDLPSLTELKLTCPRLWDMSGLAQWPTLTKVDLSGCQDAGLHWLCQLPNLATLKLSSHFQVRNISYLTGMRALTDLDLSHCTQLTNDHLKVVSRLVTLRKLSLAHTKISNVNMLSTLVNLEHLDVSHTRVVETTLAGKIDILFQ